ncbi:MAG: hypothetical protein QGH06_06335 [Lutibacter sp.]|jgi:hypothetical protein|nr:hypothetical protein [Lutibacter sp.]
MISINLTEVNHRMQIAAFIRRKMRSNGISKSEIISATNLSKTAVSSVLDVRETEKDYKFGTLIKVLNFLKIGLFVGTDLQDNSKVLSLFNSPDNNW